MRTVQIIVQPGRKKVVLTFDYMMKFAVIFCIQQSHVVNFHIQSSYQSALKVTVHFPDDFLG